MGHDVYMTETTCKTETRCLRPGCGRILRAASSVKAGYGPVCRAKIRATAARVALMNYTAAQIDKAAELISDGGLIPVRAGLFRAASSRGDCTYLTDADGRCDCPAGQHGRRCYHTAAAVMVTLAA